jgi:Cytochrome c3
MTTKPRLGALAAGLSLAALCGALVSGTGFAALSASTPTAQERGSSPDRTRLVLAHQNTSFPLVGKHKLVECGACHVNGIVGGTPEACEACHWSRRQDDPNRLQLGAHCGDCHTPQNWARILPGSFDHAEKTGFRLEGKHRTLACTECHTARNFSSATAECATCHMNDFRSAKMPDHLAANFPTNCELCHVNETQWQGARFDHSSFALTGPHKAIACESCHQGGRFAGTPTDCIGCHRADFESAKSPNHLKAGFSTECTQCHGASPSTWQGAKFDHDRVFPLRGDHRAIACDACHRNGVFTGTPSNCVDCHRTDYEQTRSPSHVQAGFPTDCVACHGSAATSWTTAGFDHASVFPLKGTHKTLDCAACHKNGQFTATPSDCVDCHRSEYDHTSKPNHVSAGFSTNCVGCHGDNASSWLGASFDHDRVFPLQGRHKTADCTQCHVNGRFAGTPGNCVDCHRADYDRTTNPNHARAGFGTDCMACHGSTATTWAGAGFDHGAFFQLNGRHKTTDCTQCHVNGRFAGTPSNCIDCHRKDYDRTASPNHARAGFSTDCTGCHGTQANTWAGASFDHNRFFQLNGRHKTVDCAVCHPGGRYAGTPSNCIDCHRTDYDRTTSPNHAQAGFATDCTSCHGNQATSWAGASFDHNQFFPLQGAHRTLDCQVCHKNGYNLPRDCYGCHAADYTAARNPDHVRSGFPTSCQNCHFPTHTSWSQAVFQHAFPINSGPHARLDCSECHHAATMQEFSCIDCHTHNKSNTDNIHRDVGGYAYNSQACYACHPNGRH